MPDTNYRKSPHSGWRASTHYPMPDLQMSDKRGAAELHIETSKASRGGVETTASVCRVDGTALIFELGTGFYKRVLHDAGKCTEKAVRAQHAHALTLVLEIMAEVHAFYVAKAARDAARGRV